MASLLRITKAGNLRAFSARPASFKAVRPSLSFKRAAVARLFSTEPAKAAPAKAAPAAVKEEEEIQWGDPVPVEKPENKLGIFDKYGAFPILGFGAAIAISKELLILSEELVLVLTFSSFVTTAYFAFSDTVNRAAKENYESILAEYRQLYNDHIKAAQEVVDTHQRFVDSVKDNAGMLEYYLALQKRMKEAAHLRLQHAVRQEFVDRLNKLAQMESEMLRSSRQLLLENASKFVRTAFQNTSAQLRSSYLTSVLKGLKKQSPNAAIAPIARLYKEYFKQFQAKRKLAQTKEHVASPEEIQKQLDFVETLKSQGHSPSADWKPVTKGKLLF